MVDKYLVIGNPITHSKSPFIHQSFAAQTDQNLSYDKQLVAVDEFENFIKQFQGYGGKGCNITVPFKEQAFSLADQLSPRAKAAGAVNTLIFNNDGTISGDNTDGQGLVADILAHDIVIKNKRILLIGAGGAARGCILPLLAQKPQVMVIANRSKDKAIPLAEKFGNAGNVSGCGLNEINGEFDIIINSTSASLSNQLPNIDHAIVAKASCCYDMAYGNEETCFLRWARELGVQHTIDGLGMLVGQAAESFRLWRGITPATTSVLAHLRQQLTQS